MANIDLKTIDEHLAKAKEETAFWERARAVVLDPRIANIAETPAIKPPPKTALLPGLGPPPRPYGELKRKVLEALPEYGSDGVTTTEIAVVMEQSGYQFATRTPGIAVNEALVSLGDQVKIVGRRGIAKLWTKGAPKH